MKLQELKKLIREEINKNQLEVNINNKHVEIISPQGYIDGFIDEGSKFRLKHFDSNDIIIFTDTIEGNEDYNTTLKILTKYNIPFKIRKAKIDNSVRIMMNITNLTL